MGSAENADRERAALILALSRVAAGERAALRDVYQRTASKLFGICLRICRDREAAEDILQDVYLKIWNRAGRFDATRASPITWLCAIARNAAIDWLRAQSGGAQVSVELAGEVPDDAASAPDRIEALQTRARVFQCLDMLEVRQGSAIRAAFFDGLTYAQLAEVMKVPLGTMKSWVRRGLMQMRACLDDG